MPKRMVTKLDTNEELIVDYNFKTIDFFRNLPNHQECLNEVFVVTGGDMSGTYLAQEEGWFEIA